MPVLTRWGVSVFERLAAVVFIDDHGLVLRRVLDKAVCEAG